MKRGLLIITTCLSGFFGLCQSVLQSGDWYKIGVTQDGVYKIDRDFLSKTLKLNVSSLDPRTLKIYGKGGELLPQPNSEFRHSDPPENAIYAFGQDDGKMDDGDYFLFYGQSSHRVSFDENGELVRKRNYYSDTTYYLLTIGGTPGKRMATRANGTSSEPFQTTFPDFIYSELDETNILQSGREWFGEGFGS